MNRVSSSSIDNKIPSSSVPESHIFPNDNPAYHEYKIDIRRSAAFPS